MIKVLVISDTHGDLKNFDRLVKLTGMPDVLIHCGDFEGTEGYFESEVPCKKLMVRGNCDIICDLEPVVKESLNNLDIMVTHGHRYSVYYGLDTLFETARENRCKVIFYGHTHVPSVKYDEETGIWAVNPGSLSRPRQVGGKPSYILMEVEDDGTPHFMLNYLDL